MDEGIECAHCQEEREQNQHPEALAGGVSRRAFLRGLAGTTAATLLAACGADLDPFADQLNTATPARVLASPRAPGTPEGVEFESGTPAPGDLTLQEFLTVSVVLTGVPNLNPLLGRVYLNALQAAGGFGVSLRDFWNRAGFDQATPPSSIAELEQAGIFDEEATRTLADTILEYWYTGVYTTPEGEQKVATFVDALAWKTLVFTKPNSICASPGFWEERPTVTLPRDPNPRPSPTATTPTTTGIPATPTVTATPEA